MNRPLLPAAALLSVLLLAGTDAAAQTVQETAQPVAVTSSTQPVASPLPVEKPEEAAPVDVRPVWNFLHQHDYPHARDEVARLHQQSPAWSPPADLLQSLRQAEIDDAREHHQPETIRAAAAAHPELFACPSVYNLWTLADADIALHDRSAAETIYARIIGECDEKAILSTLDQASGKLPPDRLAALLAQAEPRVTSEAGKQHLKTLHPHANGHANGLDLTPIASLLKSQQTAKAQRLTAAIAPQIAARRDYAAAKQLGWMYFKAHQTETAAHWFGQALAWHPDADALNGAVLCAAVPGQWQKVDELTEQYKKFISPALQKESGGMFAEAAGIAAKANDFPAARHYAERATAYGSNDGWAPLGWTLLGGNQPAEALDAFAKAPDSDSVRTGRALALQHSGDLEGAERLACKSAAEKLSPCGGILSQLADKAFQAEQWDEVRRLASEAVLLDAADRGLRMQDAWSAYRQGHFSDAATLFAYLYQTHPDRESADGLLSALKADGRGDEAKQLAASDNGPFSESYTHTSASTYYDRKQFVAAEAVSPGAYPQLAAIGTTQAGTGVGFRDRSGAPGQDRLQAATGYVDGSQSFGDNILDGRVESGSYRIGTPHPGDAVGSAAPSWTRSPTTSANLTTPTVRWSHQDDVAYAVEVGTTPLGGAVNGRPVGSASATLHNDGNSVTGAVFSQPRLDSLLSAAGMTDPATGRHWGRVTESGAQLEGYQDIGDDWSVAAHGLGSTLDGDGVASNSRASLGVAVNYTLHPAWFDYLRVGPNYVWETYSKDLSHFTLGQGGYYSPAELNLPYLSAEFLTSEGQRFQLWGQANLGWNDQSERASPYFPLMGGGRYFAGSQSSGLSGYGALQAAYLLSPHWIANAFAWTASAPSYRESAVGAGISYDFDGRASAMSSDLPQRMGQPRY